MDNSYDQRHGSDPVTRRELLAKGAAGAVGLGFATQFLGSPESALANQALKPLTVLGPNTPVIKGWTKILEKATGLSPSWTNVQDDPGVFLEKAVQGQGAADFDLLHFDGGVQTTLQPLHLTVPITTSRITGFDHIPASVRNNVQMTLHGRPYVAVSTYNADSFGYWPKILGPQNSYKILFDDNRTLGKVALEDTWLTSLPFAATYLTYHNIVKIKDPSNMTPAEAHATVDFLIHRKKAGQFRTLWQSWQESLDLLGSKEVLAIGCWEPAIRALNAEGKDVAYAHTIEGYNKWMYGFYVPAHDVGNHSMMNEVYRFINFFYSGYYNAQAAVQLGYAGGRPDLAVKYVDEHPHAFSKSDAAYVRAKFHEIDSKYKAKYFNQNTQPTHLDAIASEWQRFKQA